MKLKDPKYSRYRCERCHNMPQRVTLETASLGMSIGRKKKKLFSKQNGILVPQDEGEKKAPVGVTHGGQDRRREGSKE